MKKITIVLLAALTLVMSACVGSKSDNTQTRDVSFVSRTTGPGLIGVQLCNNTASLSIDYNANTVVMKTTLALGSSKTVYFETPAMTMSYDPTLGAIVFSASYIQATSGDVINNIAVQWNASTGAMLISAVVNGEYVSYGNTGLVYVACKEHSVIDTEKEQDEVTVDDVQLAFAFDSSSKKGAMTIYGLQLGTHDIKTTNVVYSNMDVAYSADGYEFTADKVSATTANTYYDLTDFKATLSNNTRRVDVSFTCNNHRVTISGNLFNPDAE